MATQLTTRVNGTGQTNVVVKSSPLTNEEIDNNFLSLKNEKLEIVSNLSDLDDVPTARTNLELGSVALQDSDNVSITGGSVTGITDLSIDDGGTGASTASGARTNLGVGTISTQDSDSVSITGGSVTGITDLAVGDGGTGASTASGARTNLGVGTISTQDSDDVTITGGSVTGITDLAIDDGGTGASTASGARTNLGVDSDSIVEKTGPTGSAELPFGTSAERDGTPDTGYVRFNTELSQFEGYDGVGWGSLGGGATGNGGDEVFVQNDQVVTTNYTIPADKNAMTAGPIDINSGVTVTVSTGARWVVI